jgi:hypothetical protein
MVKNWRQLNLHKVSSANGTTCFASFNCGKENSGRTVSRSRTTAGRSDVSGFEWFGDSLEGNVCRASQHIGQSDIGELHACHGTESPGRKIYVNALHSARASSNGGAEWAAPPWIRPSHIAVVRGAEYYRAPYVQFGSPNIDHDIRRFIDCSIRAAKLVIHSEDFR